MTREAAARDSGSGTDPNIDHVVPTQSRHWDLDLLTPDDVCALLKVKKSWLYDAVETGALEAVRLGKQLRFRPSALIRYLDQNVNKIDRRPRSTEESSLQKRKTALLRYGGTLDRATGTRGPVVMTQRCAIAQLPRRSASLTWAVSR